MRMLARICTWTSGPKTDRQVFQQNVYFSKSLQEGILVYSDVTPITQAPIPTPTQRRGLDPKPKALHKP